MVLLYQEDIQPGVADGYLRAGISVPKDMVTLWNADIDPARAVRYRQSGVTVQDLIKK